jgi:2-polyprenyl-6-methoxyphenol hydroxylase-like FAD-dependent oxidoreductase
MRARKHTWHLPRLVAAMREADDLFFDIVSQIHMPTWAHGRVALVGAYILAGELASHADHADAFAAYEQKARPFVEQNQALATSGATVMVPSTQEMLDARNEALRDPTRLTGAEGRAANTSLILPDYRHAE